MLLKTIDDLVGDDVDVEVLVGDISLDAPFDGPLVEAMVAAINAEDPGAVVLPYCLSGGTDNKALSRCWASRATASRLCNCPPISTSPRCFTASTSGSR